MTSAVLQNAGRIVKPIGEFDRRGVEVVAVSGDTPERAQQSNEDWRLGRLTIGCQMSLETMREWELFISQAITEDEPEYFRARGEV